MADRVWGAYQRDWARPLWDSDLSEWHKLEAEINEAGWKYLPIGILLVTHNAYWAQAHTKVALDGCRLTVALARYRLKHGAYPQTLDALVPEFLAELPIDRYSGKPFLYKLTDGKPLLYAAGVDQDDDGGEPMTPNNGPWPGDGWQDKPPAERPSGDWIIWPPRRD